MGGGLLMLLFGTRYGDVNVILGTEETVCADCWTFRS